MFGFLTSTFNVDKSGKIWEPLKAHMLTSVDQNAVLGDI